MHYWPLWLVMLLGFGLRCINLSAHSLLLDEAFVAVGARDIARNHTPMWDAISNAPFVWIVSRIMTFAHSDAPWLLRLPSAIMGVATIPATYLLARRLFDARIALLAAVLYAIHPFSIAFSRILFADSFQVFFIVWGCYAIDRAAVQPWNVLHTRKGHLLLVALLWALAFLMKYNAIVPGGLFLAAGVIARRYALKSSVVLLLVMIAGALLTLALWPYDATLWLVAFLEKGGTYDLPFSVSYYYRKLHLILFGLTEVTLLGGLVIGYRNRLTTSSSFALVATFIILYTFVVILLGRTFQRYLLVVAPVACTLVAAFVYVLLDACAKESHTARKRAWITGLCLLLAVWAYGVTRTAWHYVDYLRNDVDLKGVATHTLELEQQGHRGYWLLPEPVGAYYLGFTQHYSRWLRPGLDGPVAEANYFEWHSVPYAREIDPYSVLLIRNYVRHKGFFAALKAPLAFVNEVNRLKDSSDAMPVSPAVDYLTSDSVRHGDLLVMQGGFRDIAGEPSLEDLTHASRPPFLSRLPLENFEIVQAWRPGGPSSIRDTTIDNVRAGNWILQKR